MDNCLFWKINQYFGKVCRTLRCVFLLDMNVLAPRQHSYIVILPTFGFYYYKDICSDPPCQPIPQDRDLLPWISKDLTKAKVQREDLLLMFIVYSDYYACECICAYIINDNDHYCHLSVLRIFL